MEPVLTAPVEIIEPAVVTEPQGYGEGASNKAASRRRKCVSTRQKLSNFSPKEDVFLVTSWLEISSGPIVNTGQKKEGSWARITSQYNNKRGSYPERSLRSIQSRFDTIKDKVSKFAGHMEKVLQDNPSEISDANKTSLALANFASIEGYPFIFMHCWDLLKDEPKWMELNIRGARVGEDDTIADHLHSGAINIDDDPATPSSHNSGSKSMGREDDPIADHLPSGAINTDDDPATPSSHNSGSKRPMGTDAAKRAAKKSASSSLSDSSQMNPNNTDEAADNNTGFGRGVPLQGFYGGWHPGLQPSGQMYPFFHGGCTTAVNQGFMPHPNAPPPASAPAQMEPVLISQVQIIEPAVVTECQGYGEGGSKKAAGRRRKDVSTRQKLSNFSPKEDVFLVTSWLEISINPIVNTGQKKEAFWARITSQYNNKRGSYPERSLRSIQSRFDTIKDKVSKFAGHMENVLRDNPSEISDANKISLALANFAAIEGYPFIFMHCWDLLKDEPKWMELNIRGARVGEDDPIADHLPSGAINVDDDPATPSSHNSGSKRPMGREDDPVAGQLPSGSINTDDDPAIPSSHNSGSKRPMGRDPAKKSASSSLSDSSQMNPNNTDEAADNNTGFGRGVPLQGFYRGCQTGLQPSGQMYPFFHGGWTTAVKQGFMPHPNAPPPAAAPAQMEPVLISRVQIIEPAVVTEPQGYGEGGSKKAAGRQRKGVSIRQKLSNFSPMEDVFLVTSWLEISNDPIVNTGQKEAFWARITSQYNNKRGSYPERSLRSIQSRFDAIKDKVSKFAGYMENVLRDNPSEISDANKTSLALANFVAVEGYPFILMHCWDLLKDEPKWMELNIRGARVGEDDPIADHLPSGAINIDDDLATPSSHNSGSKRPMGRDAAKRAAKKSASSSLSDSSQYVSKLQDLSMQKLSICQEENAKKGSRYEQMAAIESQRYEEVRAHNQRMVAIEEAKLRLMRSKAEIEQTREEERILTIDLEQCAPMLRKYYEKKQRDILQRIGASEDNSVDP